MILVDTSVLLEFLRGKSGLGVSKFRQVLERGMPYAICPLVYQEVLQLAASEQDLERLKSYLGTIPCLDLKAGRESYARAAEIHAKCRQAGRTMTTIDCLIAQIAIENDVPLLHNDADFDRIAAVVKELRIY